MFMAPEYWTQEVVSPIKAAGTAERPAAGQNGPP